VTALRVQDGVVTGRVGAGGSLEAELARAAAFRSVLRRFLRRTDEVAARAGLTPQRYDLLLMIHSADRGRSSLRMSELCELLQMQQTAVSELVKRAEAAGLVEREPSPDDGRVWLLRVTPEGDARLLRTFEALREDRAALDRVFRDLDVRFRAASR
jgi:DNA-binding MarR family transcriptional regulator